MGGIEETADGAGLGAQLAALHDLAGGGVGLNPEVHADVAVRELRLGGVTRADEDLRHLAVLGEHLREEAFDAALAADFGEVLEQDIAHALAVVGVLDKEGHVAHAGGQERIDNPVASHGHDVPALLDDEGDLVIAARVEPAVQVLVGELGVGSEKAQILGVIGDATKELHEARAVRIPDGAQRRDGTVVEDDIRVPGCIPAVFGLHAVPL